MNHQLYIKRFATIFTPQGDGNFAVANREVTPFLIFATIFTPQGDGNCDCRNRFAAVKTKNSPRYLPRKGTETQMTQPEYVLSFEIRHDIYPARGRKQSDDIGKAIVETFIRHDIYPARGRKQRADQLLGARDRKFATIFTPQGDGNPMPF